MAISQRTSVPILVALVAGAVALSGCGSGGLSASSSCKDFNDANINERTAAVEDISKDRGQNDVLRQGGYLLDLQQQCPENPDASIGEILDKADQAADNLVNGKSSDF